MDRDGLLDMQRRNRSWPMPRLVSSGGITGPLYSPDRSLHVCTAFAARMRPKGPASCAGASSLMSQVCTHSMLL